MASSIIGALRVNLGIDTAAFSDGLKGAQSKLSSFGAALRPALLGLAAAGTGAAIAVGNSVRNTINAADEMSKAASKFGIPIEELSRLKYAADLSDVSLEGLGTSVGRLSRTMADAAGGGAEATKKFAEAGIAFQNSDGTLRAASDVLSDLADKFASMPDGAAKTALAMDLLGKSGAEMIPLLNGGSEALAKMKAEADTFGQVFTEDMGANAEAVNDNITRLGGAFGSMSADLTAQLLPVLVQFTDWMVANGPIISDIVARVVEFGASLISAQAAGVALIGDFLSLLGDMAQQAAQIFIDLKNQFFEIGKELITGLMDGFSAAWAQLKSGVTEIADGVVSTFKGVLGIKSPSRVFAEIGENIMRGLSNGLAGMSGQVQGDVGNLASSLAQEFTGILTGATSFKAALGNILGQAAAPYLSKGISGLTMALGIPGFAAGTNFAPGGLAVVGERGPELVNLPRGSHVTPNNQIGAMAGVSRLEVTMGEGLEGRILEKARGQSVAIARHEAGAAVTKAPGIMADFKRRRD